MMFVKSCGWGFPAWRISKDERIIKSDPLDQVACRLVISIRFARESNDHVTGQCDAGTSAADASDQRLVFLGGVGAVHRLQDSVGAGLKREMDVFGEFR